MAAWKNDLHVDFKSLARRILKSPQVLLAATYSRISGALSRVIHPDGVGGETSSTWAPSWLRAPDRRGQRRFSLGTA